MNEPVAYVNSMCNDDIDWKIDPMTIDGQPLYTHPVKELTDGEIIDLINRHIDYVPDEDNGMKVVGVMDFAKAILRKAQDK